MKKWFGKMVYRFKWGCNKYLEILIIDNRKDEYNDITANTNLNAEVHTGRRDFRALYALRGNTWQRVDDENHRAAFKSPPQIAERMVLHYYRYDSGNREFKEIIGAHEISGVVDAVFLRPEFLPKKRKNLG
jgi:hypothetical protein